MSRQCHQDIRSGKAALDTVAEEAAESAPVSVATVDVEAGITGAAAFFDVDNTMMRGASIFYFAQGLAARKFFPPGALTTFAWQQLKFRVGGKELSAAEIRTHREHALSFVAGRSTRQFVDVGEEIYDELMADRIWSGTLALAHMHAKRILHRDVKSMNTFLSEGWIVKLGDMGVSRVSHVGGEHVHLWITPTPSVIRMIIVLPA
jgi:hypothetical protein